MAAEGFRGSVDVDDSWPEDVPVTPPDERTPRPASDPSCLRAHVEALEGERHPHGSPAALEAALVYVEEALGALGLPVRREAFSFRGRIYENVVAERVGREPDLPRMVVGAHVDTRRGTPGADDDGSGVAGVLEAARLLAAVEPGRRSVELVVFNLEELQGWTYRVGSRRWVAAARARGVRVAGALILEMIGYRTSEAGSQGIPLPIRWMDLPRTGDFLAALGDGGSRELLAAFASAAAEVSPELRVVDLAVPLRGWPVWAVRRSDNASFWDAGWPALMLTDTANLRNPHYHGAGDLADTLDYGFMASVTEAVVETVVRLGG